MNGILRYIATEARSDEADSTLITTVLVWPILVMMMITMVEVPILFSNTSILRDDLRAGAHSAAILGGVNVGPNGSQLAATYGNAAACTKLNAVSKAILSDKVDKNDDAVTCQTSIGLAADKSFVAFNVYDVYCAPAKTSHVSDPTYCEASYNYTGIPGGAMSLIGGTQHFGYGASNLDLKQSQDGRGNKGSGIQYGYERASEQTEVCLAADCTSAQ